MQLTASFYELLHSLIDFLGLFLDAGLIVFLVNSYFIPKHIKIRRKLFYLLSFGAISTFIYFIGFSNSFLLFVTSIFFSVLLYTLFFYRGEVHMKLSICCIFCSVYFILDASYLSLYRYVVGDTGNVSHYLDLCIFFIQRVVCKLLMYVVIRFLLRNTTDMEEKLPRSYKTCLSVFCGFDIVLMLMNIFYLSPNDSGKSSPFISLFMFGCLCMILCFFYLFMSMLRGYKENLGYQLQAKEWELHQEYLIQTRELLTSSRAFRHDMKSHLFCMKGLLEQKKYGELDAYMEQFSDSDFLSSPLRCLCSDETLNTLLNQKLKKASNAGVSMSIDVRLSNRFAVQKLDLCTILSNLCDNAIDAGSAVKNPQITVEIKEIKGYLSLLVKNSTQGNVLTQNPSLSTTKGNTVLHGNGLTIIRNIAKKYGGSVDISTDEHTFTCFVLLENMFQEKSASA